MSEDYEYIRQFYDDWKESSTREEEVDKRLVDIDGYIDPRSYDTYDNSYLSWSDLKDRLDEDDNEYQMYEDMFNYHPTVGNINYKKMGDLPYHERLWEKDGYKDYHYRTPYKIEKAYRIFKASEGRPLSSLRRRLKPLLKGRRTFSSVVKDWSTKVLFYEDGTYDILDRYGDPGPNWNQKHGDFHYVDIEDKLQYVPPIVDPEREKQKEVATRKHLEWRRRYEADREEKEKSDPFILSVINKPAIIMFYKNLLSRRDSIVDNIRKWEDYAKVPHPKEGKWTWWLRPSKPTFNESKELVDLKITIEQMQSGNLSPFYTSVNYLYSIGKECPHFNNP